MEYTSVQELVALAKDGKISDVVLQCQAEESHTAPSHLVEYMQNVLSVMRESVDAGLAPDLRSNSGMVGGQAHLLMSAVMNGKSVSGTFTGRMEARALAVAESNACMGKIVAAPTAGACGILPGAVIAMMEEKDVSEDEAVEALFVAAAVGQSIATQASISGAEGGCQAECGSAAAMAAAALTYLQGGNPQQCADAAAFALMNLLGLVCDPVGGLVEVPCVYRNVGSSGVAFTAADMVLSGLCCPIAPDEVILAMKEVGDALPSSLRETGEGGCAACGSICARLKM